MISGHFIIILRYDIENFITIWRDDIGNCITFEAVGWLVTIWQHFAGNSYNMAI